MRYNLKGPLWSFLHSLIDFVYPPLCLSCQRLLEHGDATVCPACWDSIKTASRGSALFKETEEKLVTSGFVDTLISCFVFEKEGVFQAIVHNLKYAGVQSLGIELGRRVGRLLVENGTSADAIVPVPLHRKKLRERGYNQAELIAIGISRETGIPVRSDLVRRRKYTKTQTLLSLHERRQNMEEAFEVPPIKRREVRERKFIVVDDVVTTGSTMIACAQVLCSSGALSVMGASVALAE
jgi:ComF family protein